MLAALLLAPTAAPRRLDSHKPSGAEVRAYRISSGLTTPKFPPDVADQYHLFTEGYDADFIEQTIDTQNIMNSIVGGYDRYVYLTYSMPSECAANGFTTGRQQFGDACDAPGDWVRRIRQ